MYLDNYDHLVLNTAAKNISTEANVSLTKAKAMLFNAIDDPEFKNFVIDLSKRQGFIPNK